MQSILATGGGIKERRIFIDGELDRIEISKFDRIYLNANDSVKIKQILYLISELYKKPINSKNKAGIILEAEKATVQAQNALLKLLEEPPKTARLFLSAPNPKHLLPTITSRCKIIRLPQALGKLQDLHDLKAAIAPQSIAIAFQIAEKYGKNRETADAFLKNALLYIRQQYLKCPRIPHRTLHITHYAQLACKIQVSRRLIASNVNPRQVLENLFL